MLAHIHNFIQKYPKVTQVSLVLSPNQFQSFVKSLDNFWEEDTDEFCCESQGIVISFKRDRKKTYSTVTFYHKDCSHFYKFALEDGKEPNFT